jgi:hypothetical protein
VCVFVFARIFLGRLLRLVHWERGFIHRDRIWPSHAVGFVGDSDPSLSDQVRDLRVAQAGRVVFEGQAIVLFVHAETPQSVKIGEFSQTS